MIGAGAGRDETVFEINTMMPGGAEILGGVNFDAATVGEWIADRETARERQKRRREADDAGWTEAGFGEESADESPAGSAERAEIAFDRELPHRRPARFDTGCAFDKLVVTPAPPYPDDRPGIF